MLSETQKHIYQFIVAYQKRNGFPPSIREIGNDVGLSSTASVSYQLSNLSAKGYIERVGKGARQLRVLGSGNESKGEK